MTTTEHNAVLADLVAKRDAHVAHSAQLADERRSLSFAAVTGNETARKKLTELNEKAVLHQVELENITAAIDEARKRVEAARQEEARKADREKAKNLRDELLPELTDLCARMDTALAEFVSCSNAATAVVRKLNAAGAGPLERLFVLNSVTVVNSSMWKTPLAREYPATPPGQRKVFWELLESGWLLNIRRRIAELDGAAVTLEKTAVEKAA
jgi:hypothetical protein